MWFVIEASLVIYSVGKVEVKMSVLGQTTDLCGSVPSSSQWSIVGAYEKLVRLIR